MTFKNPFLILILFVIVSCISNNEETNTQETDGETQQATCELEKYIKSKQGITFSKEGKEIQSFECTDVYIDREELFFFMTDTTKMVVYNYCDNSVEFMLRYDKDFGMVMGFYRTHHGEHLVVIKNEDGLEEVWAIEYEMDRIFVYDTRPEDIKGVRLERVE